LARKWGYTKKRIPDGEAMILACAENFHGRTITVISMSTDPSSRDGFGPFLPNVASVCPGSKRVLKFNVLSDLEDALKVHGSKVAGFIVEPIQGEAG
jgi:ornithine--oxo-acid transaminase